ncbi:acetyl-CoA carboxylase, carboxyltransferase subunit beta [Ruminococcus sp.]|uniref:acetyl-CoA carboxylase, carboxyltransferase subunit beta n=1 Tax=Ruminococcus sp. TaxID=41978 RepID=UPI0025DFE73E|nr:acetyl-CoA carboxylase, carboxyltransferase subunit beta [Ruminococcus sp.]
MFEDFFNVVKKRWGEGEEEYKPPMFKCPRCQGLSPLSKYEELRRVCPKCNYHGRLSSNERIAITVDKDSFKEFNGRMRGADPLNFPDYLEKQTELRASTGLSDAVITGTATIKGSPVVIGVMDSRFMMGSMGSVVGEKITRAFEYATERKLPVVMFTASGGARMQEGIVSLMQMAKTSGAVKLHSEAGGLYISVMTDPTTGGVTASFASLGDIIIAEPKVLIGFAGRRVIEGTIKQRLPEDFQLAEFMYEKGFVDMIVERRKLRSVLSHLLKLHGYTPKEA